MNRDQIIRLLQVVQAYDNRTIDGITINAWATAAQIARWRPEAAEKAVHAHYATSTAWLMPGHVTEQIRLAARQPAPAEEVLALEKKPASPERRAELMAQIRKLADRKAMP